jgi:hypothetical protein
MASSGQSPSMMMVTIVRRRIVCFLRCQADAVIRSATGTDQRLVLTVVTKSDTAGEVLQALVRCIGVVMVSCADVEVPHTSPDANRTRPT